MKISQRKLTDLSTLPVRCNHITLRNPKKLFTILFIHTSDYLRYLREEQTVIYLPTPTWTCHHTNLWSANFFIWLKVCCVLSNVGGSKESQLCVHIGGYEKNRFWCAATGMSGKQRHSKCSEWPPYVLIHASSLFRHWSVA